MSDFLPILVLRKSAAKRSIAKSLNDMAKVQIKSEKLTPFGGIFPIMVRGYHNLSNLYDT